MWTAFDRVLPTVFILPRYQGEVPGTTYPIGIGIDDPSFQKDRDTLVVDLFNGAKSGSITHGERLPITTAVIAANFTQRLVSIMHARTQTCP